MGDSTGFFGGLAQGISSGAPIGLAARAQNTAEQEMQMKMAAEADKTKQEQIKNQLAGYQQLTTLYKDTHKTLRPKLWPVIAQKTNELFGTQFDPNIVPESANDGIEAAHHEIQNFLDKKQTYGDTMKKLGYLAVTLDEDTRKAVDASKGFLTETPEGQKAKDQGTGSYTFSGYDPQGKPVFSFSKSPTLVTSDGQQFNGAIQSKDEPTKNKHAIADVDQQIGNIQDLKAVLDQVPAGWKGGAESIIGKASFGNVFKKAAQYSDQVPAIAVAFYRTATGDNRINDADAKERALPFMPQAGEPTDQRQAKFDQMMTMLNRRKDAIAKGISEVPWNPAAGAATTTAPPPPAVPPPAAGGSALSPAAAGVISKWGKRP